MLTAELRNAGKNPQNMHPGHEDYAAKPRASSPAMTEQAGAVEGS